MMTKTKVSRKIMGTAWPRHFNKVIAETMYENIKKIGLPKWSEEDQTLAKAVQKEVKSYNQNGLSLKLSNIGTCLLYTSDAADE